MILDVLEYERMADKLELLEDIEVATEQLDSGKGIAHNIVKSRLIKRQSR